VVDISPGDWEGWEGTIVIRMVNPRLVQKTHVDGGDFRMKVQSRIVGLHVRATVFVALEGS
jgi:hypothetical protein